MEMNLSFSQVGNDIVESYVLYDHKIYREFFSLRENPPWPNDVTLDKKEHEQFYNLPQDLHHPTEIVPEEFQRLR